MWKVGGIFNDKGYLITKIYYKINDKGQLLDHKFVQVRGE